MAIWKFLVSALAIYCVSFDLVQAGKTNIEKINEFLEQNCDKPDQFLPNIEAAKKMLLTDEATKKSLFGGKTVAENLNTFISLAPVESKQIPWCTPESTAILKTNNEMVNDVIEQIKKNGLSSIGRIEKLVYGVLKKHGFDCWNEYMKKYDAIKGSLDKETVYKVSKLAKGLVFEDAAREVMITFDDIDAKHGADTLASLADKFKDADKQFAIGKADKDKYSQLFDKYMKQPCATWMKEVSTILEPAIIDAHVTVSIPDEIVKYKVCQFVTGEQSQKLEKKMFSESA